MAESANKLPTLCVRCASTPFFTGDNCAHGEHEPAEVSVTRSHEHAASPTTPTVDSRHHAPSNKWQRANRATPGRAGWRCLRPSDAPSRKRAGPGCSAPRAIPARSRTRSGVLIPMPSSVKTCLASDPGYGVEWRLRSGHAAQTDPRRPLAQPDCRRPATFGPSLSQPASLGTPSSSERTTNPGGRASLRGPRAVGSGASPLVGACCAAAMASDHAGSSSSSSRRPERMPLGADLRRQPARARQG